MTHTYEHTFRNGVKATATLNDAPPTYGVKWNGKPNRKVLGEYLAWRETILADFTERTGKKILVVNLT
jgi:hypothetical protein